jgi:hypothetical protein
LSPPPLPPRRRRMLLCGISALITREDEMFTTAGATRFTMPEYPRRVASAARGAVFSVAGGFVKFSAACTPTKPVTASAAARETPASHWLPLKNLFDILFATSITSLGSTRQIAHTFKRVQSATATGDKKTPVSGDADSNWSFNSCNIHQTIARFSGILKLDVVHASAHADVPSRYTS